MLGFVVVSFYMRLLEQFSAVVAIMVAQTRKFLTMLLSLLLFPKPFSVAYLLTAGWVLFAIALNVLVKQNVCLQRPQQVPAPMPV